MPKRALVATAASLVPLALVAAPSAQATPACNISAPSKVAITKPYTAITATFSYGCHAYAESAWWDVMHSRKGWEGSFHYEGSTTDVYDFYADWDPLGTYTLRPDFAYDFDYDDMPQNTRKMTVKLGSRQYIRTSRSRSTVTIAGTTTRYSPTHERFTALPRTRVYLQSKSCSSCAWKPVTSTTTNRYGKVTFKRTSSSARYWRLKTIDSSNTFGRTSATSRR